MKKTVPFRRFGTLKSLIAAVGVIALTASGVVLTFAAVEQSPPKTDPPAAKASDSPPAAQPQSDETLNTADQKKVFDDLVDLYIYAFPAVLMDQMQREMTDSIFFAPVNKMAYRTVLPSPSLRISECPNVDSLLATAWFDLAAGPQVVLMPAVPKQDYLMELIDGWTNVIGNIDSISSGDWPVYEIDGRPVKAFALQGPNSNAPLPIGMKSFTSPTNRLWLLNRVLLGAPRESEHLDRAAVCRTLYEFEILPLAEFEKHIQTAPDSPAPTTDADNGALNLLTPDNIVFVTAKSAGPLRERFVLFDDAAAPTPSLCEKDKDNCDKENKDDCEDQKAQGDQSACDKDDQDKDDQDDCDEMCKEAAKTDADNDADNDADDNAENDGDDNGDDNDDDNADDDEDADETEVIEELATLSLVVPAPSTPSDPSAAKPNTPSATPSEQPKEGEKAKSDTKPADVKPSEKPAEKSADKPSEQAAEKSVEKPAEKPADKSIKKPSAQNAPAQDTRYEIRRGPFRRYEVVIRNAAYHPNADNTLNAADAPESPAEKPSQPVEVKPEPKAPAAEVKPEPIAPAEIKPNEMSEATKPEVTKSEAKTEEEPKTKKESKIHEAEKKIGEKVEEGEERADRYGRDMDRYAHDMEEAMDRMERDIAEFFSRGYDRSRAMAHEAMESGADAAKYFDRRAKRGFHSMAQDFAPVFGGVEWKLHPLHRVLRMSGGEFFGRFAEIIKSNPPAETDLAMTAKMKAVGIVPGESFDLRDASPITRHLARFAIPYAQMKIHEAAASGADSKRGATNWIELKDLGNFGTNYLCRAVIAEKFLGADVPAAILYPFTFLDALGNPLDGTKSYRIHFEPGQTPPAEFLWSISLYDAAFQPASNRIKRYSIRSNQPLVFNQDGSLDLVISNAEPSENLSNWLPAPEGNFMLMARLYRPKAAALDGSWTMPGVMEMENGKWKMENGR